MRPTLAFVLPFAIPIVATLVSSCASSPPPELKSARSACAQVVNGPVAHLVPLDVDAAKDQLAVAERAYREHGDSEETRDLAYAAERKVQLAQVHAQTVTDALRQGDAYAQVLALTSAQLSMTRKALATERGKAEQRAEEHGDATKGGTSTPSGTPGTKTGTKSHP